MLWWTIQNLAIAATLAGLVALACRLRPIGPVGRHALWLVVLLKLLTPPLMAWPWTIPNPLAPLRPQDKPTIRYAHAAPPRDSHLPAAPPAAPSERFEALDPQGPSAIVIVPSQSAPPLSPSIGLPAASHAPRITLDQLIRWSAATWIAGAAAFALLQCARVLLMLRRLRRARPADGPLISRVHRLAHRLHTAPVRTLVLSGIDSPFIWSLRKPLLVWPAELPADMSADAIDGLIVHELAHLKRRDHWVGWLELLAGCAWWWNPLFWYIRHQLRENAELACDAWVVDALPAAKGRRAYAEALLAVCEAMSQRQPGQAARQPLPALGVGTGSRRFLERRLTMILRERTPLRLPRLGVMIVALIAAAALPAWSQKAPGSDAKPGTTSAAAADPTGAGALPGTTEQSTDYERVYRFLGAVSSDSSDATASQARALPDDAQDLVSRFESEEAQARRQLEDRLASQRDQLVSQLQDLRDRYSKEGRLDAAIAIGVRIRQLQYQRDITGATAGYNRFFGTRSVRAAADPGDLTAYRDRVGQSFVFRVTGSTRGSVWGTNVYTDDSTLATAAVHASILRDGEDGRIRVTILPGESAYEGTTRNGVTSSSYGPWPGSYRIERLALAQALPRGGGGGAPNPRTSAAPSTTGEGILQRLRGHNGDVVFIELTGSSQGAVWGTDVYTDDSSLPAAAVHAGALRDGERGMVQITILPGQDHYDASNRHGVSSQPYGPWDGSFRIQRPNTTAAPAGPGADIGGSYFQKNTGAAESNFRLWRGDDSSSNTPQRGR